jgi:E3 ubiquitin-protein ligase DOA10
MRIHDMNPNIESDAVSAVQRAEAKREADAFRKKLSESVANLRADDDGCVVSIGARQEEAEGQSEQKNQQEKKAKKEDAQPNDVNGHISDWA